MTCRTSRWARILALLLLAGAARAQGPVGIAVLPFVDEVGVQGTWELGRDLPARLAAHLERIEGLSVVPADSAFAVAASLEGPRGTAWAMEAGRRLGVPLVVWGRIEACGVRRMTAGDPNLASYKSYHYRVRLPEVELVRTGNADVWRTLSVDQDSVFRPVELNLFGKPGDEDREYQALFEVDFGSPAFLELGFGGYVDGILEELRDDLVSTIVDRPPLDLSRGDAKVLVVEAEGLVYLGIGVDNGLAVDDVVSLHGADGGRVGTAIVTEIVGAYLSKARILEATGTVEAGCRIGKRLPPQAAADPSG